MRPRSLLLVVALLVGGCGDDDGGGVRADDTTSTSAASTDVSPGLGDHLHLAFELSRCGSALPPLSDVVPDESGIHSHADGLIHVHPFVPATSGANAVLGVFFETVGVVVDAEGVHVAGETLPFTGECGGAEAVLQLAQWAPGGEMSTTVTVTDPEQVLSVPLGEDGASIAIGLVAEGSELALPSSVGELAAPADIGGPSSPPPPTGQGIRPDESLALGFAPVLGIGEPPCGDTAVVDHIQASCFELGPVGVTDEAVVNAEARDDGSAWSVQLTLSADGIDRFNAIARECFATTAACPTGQLAIAVRGVVVSAPTVNSDAFEADDISISGAYTEAEAKDLAALLDP